MAQTVSSADAHVDDKIEFEVLEEARVSHILVIPKGGIAWGTVTEAQPKRRMARGGKLESLWILFDSSTGRRRLYVRLRTLKAEVTQER